MDDVKSAMLIVMGFLSPGVVSTIITEARVALVKPAADVIMVGLRSRKGTVLVAAHYKDILHEVCLLTQPHPQWVSAAGSVSLNQAPVDLELLEELRRISYHSYCSACKKIYCF